MIHQNPTDESIAMNKQNSTGSTDPVPNEKKSNDEPPRTPARGMSVKRMIAEMKAASRPNPRDYSTAYTHPTKTYDPHRKCEMHRVQVHGYSTMTVKVTKSATEETKKQ